MSEGHALLSPSSRHRWSLCAASRREEARYPDESGPAAVDGTHTHTLLEKCVPGLVDAMTFVGQTLKDHEGEFTVDKPRAERVKIVIDYIKSTLGGEVSIQSETRVDPFYLVGRHDMSGTLDFIVRRSDLWIIGDLKDGGQPHDPIEHPQLLQYGVAVVAEAMAQQRKLPDKFRLVIAQPKMLDRGWPAISLWDIPTTRLIKEAEKLKAEGARTDDPNAPFTPGDVQCKYCKHRGNCTARAEKAMQDMGMMFPKVSEVAISSPLDIAQQAANKNPAEMPDEQIRQILDAAPLMRQLLESVEEEALNRLKAGKTIPGLKLVNGRGSRSWAHPDEEMAGKLVKMGIPKGSIYVTKLVSPAQAEKLRWKKRDGTDVQLSARQLERLNTEYIVHMGGKLTVAPESDSRPAVVLDASPMFKAVEGLKEGDRVLVKGVENFPDGVYTLGAPVAPAAPEPPAASEPPALPDWLSMSSTKE